MPRNQPANAWTRPARKKRSNPRGAADETWIDPRSIVDLTKSPEYATTAPSSPAHERHSNARQSVASEYSPNQTRSSNLPDASANQQGRRRAMHSHSIQPDARTPPMRAAYFARSPQAPLPALTPVPSQSPPFRPPANHSHPSFSHDTSARRPSYQSQPRAQPSPPRFSPRAVSPSVVDAEQLHQENRPASPTESIYPECEPPQTISWLQIADRKFEEYAGGVAEITKMEEDIAVLEHDMRLCKLTNSGWDGYDTLKRCTGDLRTLKSQLEPLRDAAGACYMLSRYMEEERPETRWWRLLPLPSPTKEIYSALGTLKASKSRHIDSKVVQSARDIIRSSLPAPDCERNRLVVSQRKTFEKMLERRGYNLPVRNRDGSVRNLDWKNCDDTTFCRHFPDMALTLTKGRDMYIPPEDRFDALKPSNHDQPDDPFARSHPFQAPPSWRPDSGQSSFRGPPTSQPHTNTPPNFSARQYTY